MTLHQTILCVEFSFGFRRLADISCACLFWQQCVYSFFYAFLLLALSASPLSLLGFIRVSWALAFFSASAFFCLVISLRLGILASTVRTDSSYAFEHPYFHAQLFGFDQYFRACFLDWSVKFSNKSDGQIGRLFWLLNLCLNVGPRPNPVRFLIGRRSFRDWLLLSVRVWTDAENPHP